MQWSIPYGIKVKPLRVHPNATAFVEGLYALRGFPPHIAQLIEEKLLKRLDGRAADALHLLETGQDKSTWPHAVVSDWTRFLISLLIRMPEDIENIRKRWIEVLSETKYGFDQEYILLKERSDPETFSEFMLNMPEEEIERGFFEMFEKLLNLQKTGHHINNMIWKVVNCIYSDLDFYTSDRPIFKSNRLDNPNAFISIPIGPRKLFLAANDQSVIDRFQYAQQKKLICQSNIQTISSAAKLAFTLTDKPRVFIQNRFGSAPQKRITSARLSEPSWFK